MTDPFFNYSTNYLTKLVQHGLAFVNFGVCYVFKLFDYGNDSMQQGANDNDDISAFQSSLFVSLLHILVTWSRYTHLYQFIKHQYGINVCC